jgi:serine/threonine protein kinase
VSSTDKVPQTPSSVRPGEHLSSVMSALRARGDAMAPALAVFIAREVARALRASPPGGAGHRDLSPARIMLLKAGGVTILDAAAPEADGKPGGGAPAYRSPEQVRGATVDHRSDVFFLGVVLWELVAGQRLFAADSESETLQNVLMQPIAEPSRRRDGIPATLDAIVARALDRDPANRTGSVEAFADELDRVLAETPVADQAIPTLLEELASAPSKHDASARDPAAAYAASRSAARRVSSGSRFYRTIPPPQPPKIPMPALIGIFLIVIAVAVTVGRVVIRHQQSAGQSSSARSVSTSK